MKLTKNIVSILLIPPRSHGNSLVTSSTTNETVVVLVSEAITLHQLRGGGDGSSNDTTTTTVDNNNHNATATRVVDIKYSEEGNEICLDEERIVVEMSTNNNSTTTIADVVSTNNNTTKRKRRKLLDKAVFSDILSKLSSTIATSKIKAKSKVAAGWDDFFYKEEKEAESHLDSLIERSDLTVPGRKIYVVTTAALPWMTGTSVNPLLRAAYLTLRQGSSVGSEEDVVLNTNTTVTSQEAKIEGTVTLVIPWLYLEEDRSELYGDKFSFSSPDEQEDYIRQWLKNEADLPEAAEKLKILFYPARYHSGLKSIFAMGDICQLIPDDDADVCILEEPEHLNWYRAPGDSYWTNKFNYVVGIVHTNYKEYASSTYSGLWTAPAIGAVSSAMVRAYCHKVIKLSDVLQSFAPEKESTCNVHGVRSDFLKEGRRRAREYNLTKKATDEETDTSLKKQNKRKAYFIGKILWAKGFDRMLELQSYYKQWTGSYFPIDVYGSGPDEMDIKRAFHGRRFYKKQERDEEDDDDDDDDDDGMTLDEQTNAVNMDDDEVFSTDAVEGADYSSFSKVILSKFISKLSTDTFEIDLPKSRYEYRKHPVPAEFPGRIDHALLTDEYSIFINPSFSEVLCTTTAEALAMGKFVIIPVHPSNNFFMRFPNCLGYRNKLEFAANLRWALQHDPESLSETQSYELTWLAATERFIHEAKVTEEEIENRRRVGKSKLDDRIAWFHNELGKGKKGDTLRKVLGGGPVSEQVKYLKEASELSVSGYEDDVEFSSSSEIFDSDDSNDNEGERNIRNKEKSSSPWGSVFKSALIAMNPSSMI